MSMKAAQDTQAITANKTFMKRFVDFINTADPKLADELVSPDAIFHIPGRPDPLTGPSGYLTVIAMMRSGFPDIQWSLEETVVEPDKVAARYIMRGTHNGSFANIAPTGRKISVQALNIYELRNGQIIREIGQPDMMALMQQIGGAPK